MTPADRDDRLIAAYASLAIVIQVLESAFPSPLPGIKPGLANVVVLVALLRYGWRFAAWVSVLRVLAGSFLLGSFMSPAFWLSAAGAAASLVALGLGTHWNRALPPAGLSALGLSVLSALAHMAGQFALAYAWFLPHPALLRLLPLVLGAALVFGIVSGVLATQILQRLPPPPS